MEIKHNPCPKCGNENPTFVRLIGSAEGCAQVRCRKCGFVGPFSQIPMDAWALWDAATAERAETLAERTETLAERTETPAERTETPAERTETLAEPRKTQQPTTRKTILDAAEKCVCQDRQDTHGKPEDSFGAIADLWTAYLGTGQEIDPVDVANMMILLKIGRAKENPKHQDNWVDMAGYAACAGEIAAEIYGE